MGLGKACALITDGRFPAVLRLSIGHVRRKAASAAALLRWIEDGDTIAIDIPNRSIQLQLSEAEIAHAARRRKLVATKPRRRKSSASGFICPACLRCARATSADGAVRDKSKLGVDDGEFNLPSVAPEGAEIARGATRAKVYEAAQVTPLQNGKLVTSGQPTLFSSNAKTGSRYIALSCAGVYAMMAGLTEETCSRRDTRRRGTAHRAWRFLRAAWREVAGLSCQKQRRILKSMRYAVLAAKRCCTALIFDEAKAKG